MTALGRPSAPRRKAGGSPARALATLLLPYPAVQPSAAVRRWTRWRMVLAGCAVLVVIAQVVPMVRAALLDWSGWLGSSHRAVVVVDHLDHGAVVRQAQQDLFGATTVLAAVALVAGRRAVGLHRRTPAEHMLAFGYIGRGFMLAMMVAAAASAAAMLWPQLARGIGTPVGSAWPQWLVQARTLQAVITEEILLTVVPYWLLEHVRTRGGRPLAHTRTGIALIAGLFVVLHGNYGPFVWALAGFAVAKVLLWRHTRNLPALLALHFLWNNHTALDHVSTVGGRIALFVGLMTLVIMESATLNRLTAGTAPGPHEQSAAPPP